MRKNNSLKNLVTSIVPFVILAVLGFIRIDVFIQKLGIETYAINQLFFQLFAYISLVEAGVGTLIQQQYYKLLSTSNYEQINGLYTSSKKLLKKVSIIILIIGLFISFSLGALTNNHLSLFYMQVVFMLFLFRSVLEYLAFSPRLVLQADQKIYKINILLNLYKFLEAILEITLLYLGGNYIIILMVSISIRSISYYLTNKKIFREYPWLRVINNEVNFKIKGIKNILYHKLSGAVYSNTDILLISAFLSPLKVAIYSSYNYIFKFVGDLISTVVTSIIPSFGNVMYSENEKDKVVIFDEINSLFMFFAVLLSSILYYVTNNFVGLWLGMDKKIDEVSFIFMIILLFHNIARKPLLIMKDTRGLFKETQIIAITEAIINLCFSFILINYFGLAGVLAATIISVLLTNFWFYPNYMYKNIIKTTVLKYYFHYFCSVFMLVFFCIISNFIVGSYIASNLVIWFIGSAIYSIVIFAIAFLFNYVMFAPFRRLTNKIKISFEELLRKDYKNEKNN